MKAHNLRKRALYPPDIVLQLCDSSTNEHYMDAFVTRLADVLGHTESIERSHVVLRYA